MLRKVNYTRSVPGFAILFAVTFLSCNFFSEPEPFVNNNGRQPESLQWKNLHDGEHVAGAILLSFTQVNDSSEINQVFLTVDTVNKGFVQYPVIFDTRNYPEGEHSIKCEVWLKDKAYGIGNIEKEYTQATKIKLYFDQTAPHAPDDFILDEENNYPRLTWKPVSDDNFYEYVIQRNGKTIAKLKGQNISVFIDSNYNLSDLENVSYDIGTYNNATTAYTKAQTIIRSKSLSFAPAICLFDGLDDKCILQTYGGWYDQYIISLSNTTLDTYGQVSSGYTAGHIYNQTYPYAVSTDQQKLFWWDGNDLYIYDLPRLFFNTSFQPEYFEGPFNFAAGLNDNLFIARSNGKLRIISTKNDGPYQPGHPYFESSLFEGQARYLSISPDGQYMIAADNNGIKKLSLTKTTAAVIQRSEIEDEIEILKPDWRNSRFFVTRQKTLLEVWDTGNLQIKGAYVFPNNIFITKEITAVSSNTNNIYAAYTVERNDSESSIIVEYNIETREQVRVWSVNKIVQSLAVSQTGQYFFAFTPSDQWIIETGGN